LVIHRERTDPSENSSKPRIFVKQALSPTPSPPRRDRPGEPQFRGQSFTTPLPRALCSCPLVTDAFWPVPIHELTASPKPALALEETAEPRPTLSGDRSRLVSPGQSCQPAAPVWLRLPITFSRYRAMPYKSSPPQATRFFLGRLLASPPGSRPFYEYNANPPILCGAPHGHRVNDTPARQLL
jgi:hypothetical protein